MNKVAIITGAGSGLGRATAVRLAKEGVNIVAVGMNENYGAQTVGMVKKFGVDSYLNTASVAITALRSGFSTAVTAIIALGPRLLTAIRAAFSRPPSRRLPGRP